MVYVMLNCCPIQSLSFFGQWHIRLIEDSLVWDIMNCVLPDAPANPTIVKKDFLASAAENKTVVITGPCLPGFERRSASRFHLAFTTWLHSRSDVTRVLPSSGES